MKGEGENIASLRHSSLLRTKILRAPARAMDSRTCAVVWLHGLGDEGRSWQEVPAGALRDSAEIRGRAPASIYLRNQYVCILPHFILDESSSRQEENFAHRQCY